MAFPQLVHIDGVLSRLRCDRFREPVTYNPLVNRQSDQLRLQAKEAVWLTAWVQLRTSTGTFFLR